MPSRRARFKFIPSIVKCPFLVSAALRTLGGMRPVIIGNKLENQCVLAHTHTHTHTHTYIRIVWLPIHNYFDVGLAKSKPIVFAPTDGACLTSSSSPGPTSGFTAVYACGWWCNQYGAVNNVVCCSVVGWLDGAFVRPLAKLGG